MSSPLAPEAPRIRAPTRRQVDGASPNRRRFLSGGPCREKRSFGSDCRRGVGRMRLEPENPTKQFLLPIGIGRAPHGYSTPPPKNAPLSAQADPPLTT